MNQKPNRLKPSMPARAMQTFQVTSPVSTHTREATCEEVECAQYARGWRMKIDLGTELGQRQAYYIKHQSGRSYRKVGYVEGARLVELEFAANQPCFAQHRVPIGRPEIYRVKGGDHRGNPLRTPVRTHKKPEFWVEEFAENQDRLKTQIERG